MTQPKGGALAKLAGMLCQNPRFIAFCSARDADEAAAYLRTKCEIESRAQLDNDAQAARRFHQIRKAFAYGGSAHA